MTRHDGSVVDVDQRMVRDRRGRWHALERLEVAGSGLYYSRASKYDPL